MNKPLFCRLGWHAPQSVAIEYIAVPGPAVQLIGYEHFTICARCHTSFERQLSDRKTVATYQLPEKKKGA